MAAISELLAGLSYPQFAPACWCATLSIEAVQASVAGRRRANLMGQSCNGPSQGQGRIAVKLPETRVYTPAQAAGVLGVSAERVRQFARAGRLPCTRTPLGRLLDADAVDAMARERAQRASQSGRR